MSNTRRTAVVVSGLPACGKSSVGRLASDVLGFPFVDKDTFLETLYDERGIGDRTWRRLLSKEADGRFEHHAASLSAAVLVSHWRPRGLDVDSGTPTAWLTAHFDNVVEIHCQCPVDVAVERFCERERHPGHRDDLRPGDELKTWFAAIAPGYPLQIGDLLEIDTSVPVDRNDIEALLKPIGSAS